MLSIHLPSSLTVLSVIFVVCTTLQLLTLPCSASPSCSGTLSITDTGSAQNVPIWGSWSSVSPSGNTLSLPFNVRAYFAKPNTQCSWFDSNNLDKFYLLGKTISFTMNVAQAGWGCNAAFFLLQMPAANSGHLGDYYCDANAVEGSSCPEIDLVEANANALQITLHKCSTASSGCDTSGCALNSRNTGNWFGPSSSYTINSAQSFNVAFTFTSSSNKLSGVQVVVTQGSARVSKSLSCKSSYFNDLTAPLTSGMVPTAAYWGASNGGLSWLDGSKTATCNNGGQVSISNVVVSGGSTQNNACGQVDEGKTLSLSCPSGTMKSITFASYGTPSGTCGAYTTGSCNASNSVSVVQNACVGKSSCSVQADNSVFGDPCSGTFKSLAVQATCA